MWSRVLKRRLPCNSRLHKYGHNCKLLFRSLSVLLLLHSKKNSLWMQLLLVRCLIVRYSANFLLKVTGRWDSRFPSLVIISWISKEFKYLPPKATFAPQTLFLSHLTNGIPEIYDGDLKGRNETKSGNKCKQVLLLILLHGRQSNTTMISRRGRGAIKHEESHHKLTAEPKECIKYVNCTIHFICPVQELQQQLLRCCCSSPRFRMECRESYNLLPQLRFSIIASCSSPLPPNSNSLQRTDEATELDDLFPTDLDLVIAKETPDRHSFHFDSSSTVASRPHPAKEKSTIRVPLTARRPSTRRRGAFARLTPPYPISRGASVAFPMFFIGCCSAVVVVAFLGNVNSRFLSVSAIDKGRTERSAFHCRTVNNFGVTCPAKRLCFLVWRIRVSLCSEGLAIFDVLFWIWPAGEPSWSTTCCGVNWIRRELIILLRQRSQWSSCLSVRFSSVSFLYHTRAVQVSYLMLVIDSAGNRVSWYDTVASPFTIH